MAWEGLQHKGHSLLGVNIVIVFLFPSVGENVDSNMLLPPKDAH